MGSAQTYGYDALQRLSTVSGGAYTKTYNYRNISDTRTTTQVSSLVYSGNVSQTYSYTYDALGNIATYTAPGKSKVTYSYSVMGQLLKATGDVTYSYTYSAIGNILTANGHKYTYGSVTGDTTWWDVLITYDGERLTYDTSGNPLSYYNGTRWTFTWEEGRRLMTATNGTTNLAFTYDSEGLRLSKTVGTTQHNYYYAGGKLLRETYGNNTLDFFYDAAGKPYALKHNGTVYYYITNLQGDVMNLVNSSGTVVATYDYDPFGKVITATGTMAAVNPLRYRGYYYDSESGLYYLQSRYYDPAIGRFINADGHASTGQGIIGHNMFAYCNNNPVNMKDASGHVPVYIITNVETEEDEDTPNTHHTMITYTIADTDDLYSAFTSNPQTVTFTYTITDGRIQMFNSKNEVILLLDAGMRNTLANAMINQAKTENNDSLSGRTTLGVARELIIHAVAYKLGFMTQKAEPVDIGSAAEGSYGYDYNAALFENPILNIAILFEILGK